MRRAIVLVVLLGAVAAPASASDAQLRYVLNRTYAKIGYIAKRLNGDRPASAAKFAARLARAAERAGRLMSHLQPSTKQGALARHAAVVGLKQLRVGARLLLVAVNTKDSDRIAELGAERLVVGLSALLAATLAL